MLPRALTLLVLLSAGPLGSATRAAQQVEPLLTPVDDTEASAAVIAVDRKAWPDPPRVTRLRALMRRLRAAGARLEHAASLSSFFRALDRTVTDEGRTGVVVFGNSLIASDGVTNVVRARLASRFGDGGRGMVLSDRMASYGPRGRTAQVASGWLTFNIAALERPPAPVGLAGVIHVSEGPASSSFRVDGERTADVFWFDDPSLPELEWRADEGPWIPIHHRATGPQVARLTLPEEGERLELRAPAAGLVSHGVALEREGGGVVLDVFGVPSADADLWLQADEESFSTQLAARRPDLITVMLGANEAKRISWGRASRVTTEESLTQFLERIRRAAPGASCLVIGPGDAVVGPGHDEPFRQRPQLTAVIAIERRVAFEHGCAFLDLYQAMGGRDSFERLADAGLVHDDLVHPRGDGLELLGQLIVDSLLQSYAKSEDLSTMAARAQ